VGRKKNGGSNTGGSKKHYNVNAKHRSQLGIGAKKEELEAGNVSSKGAGTSFEGKKSKGK